MNYIFIVALLFTLSVAKASIVSIDPRIYKDIEKDGRTNVIVRLQNKVDLKSIVSKANGDHHLKGHLVYEALKNHSEKDQKTLKSKLQSIGISFRSYWINNMITIRNVDLAIINEIASISGIQAIESNRPFKVNLEEPDYLFEKTTRDTEWNVEWVNADDVWATGNTGQNGIVMNADTGVEYTHPEIIDSYRGSNGSIVNHNFNWWDGIKENSLPGLGPCGVDSQVPCDDNNHGTHTTGTAVGTLGCGVAPGAKWIGCRNMDRGFGTPESYISCLQFAIAPTDLNGNNANPSLRPHAIGNSYGCTSSEGCVYDSLHDAVEAVRAAGIVMAVSSGNSGSSCDSINDPPGLEPSVIAVGATGFNSNSIASYSSRGPVEVWGGSLMKPELVAPGSSVRSCVRGGGYGSYSGTSMASPHVNGAVALIVTACPGLAYDVDNIQFVLEQTAQALYSNQGCGGDGNNQTPNHVYGHGQIVLDQAVQMCSKLRKN